MWIFSVLGFYSIACAQKPDGSIDKQTVMVRARCKRHIQNLKASFPSLSEAEIVTLPHRDYRFRIVVRKSVWAKVVAELADQQTWRNFKNEVAKHQGKAGAAYSRALHEVWEVMHRLQESES